MALFDYTVPGYNIKTQAMKDAAGDIWYRTQGGKWRNQRTRATADQQPGEGAGGGAAPAPSQDQLITNALTQLAHGDSAVQDALLSGQNLGNLFFGEGMLGRLPNEQMTDDEGRSLWTARELLGQNPRTDAEQAALNTMRGMVDRFSKPTTEEEEALQILRGLTNKGLGAETQNAIALYKKQLGGYTPEEKTLYQEEGNRGLDRAMATAMRAAKGANLASGHFGASAGIPIQGIARERLTSGQDLLRRMRLDELALKAERLNNYANYSRAAEEANRIANITAGRNFGDVSSTIGSNIATRTAANQATYQNAERLQRDSDITNRLNQNVLFNNTLAQIQNRMLGTQLFNLNNKNQELAGRLGTIFTAGGFGAQQQGRRDATDIAREQLDVMREMLGAGAAGGGGEEEGGGFSMGGWPSINYQPFVTHTNPDIGKERP